MNERLATLAIPPGPTQVRTARMLAAGVARLTGFDPETVEDVRLAAAEAVSLGVAGSQRLTISFELAGGDSLDRSLVMSVEPVVRGADDELAVAVLAGIVPETTFTDERVALTWPLPANR